MKQANDANIVKQVYKSQKFTEVRESFKQSIESKKKELMHEQTQVLDELDDLVKYVKLSRKEFKKEAQARRLNPEMCRVPQNADESEQEEGERKLIDVNDDMNNLFVHFDVQRRFFNIVTMELLAL